MKLVSIKDIALKAGVSTTTVSFVLNGKAREKRISEELEQQIIEIANRLNYRPNPLARGLRTGQTDTIALIVEDIANPFFAALARVIEDEAERYGYTVMFSSTDNNEQRAVKLIRGLKHRQIDGFLITPTPGLRQEVEHLRQEGRAVVLIDRYFPDLEVSSVSVDNVQGAMQATNYLLASGYKRIALVTTLMDQVQMKERCDGYEQAMNAAGLETMMEEVTFGKSRAECIKAIDAFIIEKKPEAVFFATNYLGAQGIESLRGLKASWPAIVCFDDTDLFRLGCPSVTVVAQPIEMIAREAVSLLVASLRGGEGNQREKKVRLLPQLLVRET